MGNTTESTQDKDCFARMASMSDGSHSVFEESPVNWQTQLYALADAIVSPKILEMLQKGSFMIVTFRFDETASKMVDYRLISTAEDAHKYRVELLQHLDYTPPSGVGTNYAEAIRVGIAALEDEQAKTLCPKPERIVIDIVTDGEPTKPRRYTYGNYGTHITTHQLGWQEASKAAKEARDKGFTINALPVGMDTIGAEEKLRLLITDPTLGKVFPAKWHNFSEVFSEKFFYDLMAELPSEQNRAATENEETLSLMQLTPNAPLKAGEIASVVRRSS